MDKDVIYIYIHTQWNKKGYTKKNEMMPFVEMWRQVEVIILSKVS